MTKKCDIHKMGILSTGLVLSIAMLFSAGCAEKMAGRTNAPPQGHAEMHPEMQANYVYMVDNALLNEMSMSAVHFVPNMAELNANGVRRLNRLVEILEVYGGTVAYDGFDDEESLQDERLETLREYILGKGIEAECFEVKMGLAGGRGMDASESIRAREATRVSEQGGAAGSLAPTYTP